MSHIEAYAYSVSPDGCWILSDEIDQLNERIGLKIEGYQDLIRGRIVALSDQGAQIAFQAERKLLHNEKRTEVRRAVWMTAKITCIDLEDEIQCQIVDASRSGCRIEADRVSELPNDIFLSIAGVKTCVSGTIVWRNGQQAGVRLNWPFENGLKAGVKGQTHPRQPDETTEKRPKKKRLSAFGG
nr:PilZ domain-containing protein [Roseibium hamelinense]